MKQKLTPKEFFDYCMSEGGLHEGFYFGLRSTDLITENERLKEAVSDCEDAYLEYVIALNRLKKEFSKMGIETFGTR